MSKHFTTEEYRQALWAIGRSGEYGPDAMRAAHAELVRRAKTAGRSRNPISSRQILIGVAAVGVLGVIAYEMMKPAAAAPPGPGPLPGPITPGPGPGPITPGSIVLSPNFTVLTQANSGQSVALSLSASDTSLPPSAFYLQGTDMPTSSVPNIVSITAVPGTATPTWRIAAVSNFGVTTVGWTSNGGGAVIVTTAF